MMESFLFAQLEHSRWGEIARNENISKWGTLSLSVLLVLDSQEPAFGDASLLVESQGTGHHQVHTENMWGSPLGSLLPKKHQDHN